jgi:hypothetical protein
MTACTTQAVGGNQGNSVLGCNIERHSRGHFRAHYVCTVDSSDFLLFLNFDYTSYRFGKLKQI